LPQGGTEGNQKLKSEANTADAWCSTLKKESLKPRLGKEGSQRGREEFTSKTRLEGMKKASKTVDPRLGELSKRGGKGLKEGI